MTTKRVTLDDALDALRKAVAEKGEEYQYGHDHVVCNYATFVEGEPQPACIVGHALVFLGVPAEHLAWSRLNSAVIHSELVAGLGYDIDLAAINAFRAAQRVQDASRGGASGSNTSWGAALAAAEHVADEHIAERSGGAP